MRSFLGDVFVGVGEHGKGDERWMGRRILKKSLTDCHGKVGPNAKFVLAVADHYFVRGQCKIQQTAGALRATAGRYSKLVGTQGPRQVGVPSTRVL